MSIRSNIHILVLLTSAALLATASSASALKLRHVHATTGLAVAGSVQAKCPKDFHIVSGGGSAESGKLTTTRKKGNGWLVSGAPIGSGASLTADAYCAKRDLELKRNSVALIISHADSIESVCPEGTNMISGGASIDHGALTGALPDSLGHGWEAAGASNSGATLVAYTYCTAKSIHLDWHAQQSTPVHTAGASCSEGEAPVSGGGLAFNGFLRATHRALIGWMTTSTLDADTIASTVGCL